MKSDDVTYEEKLREYAAHKYENDPDYYREDGSFIVTEKFPDGDWWGVRAIPPDPARVERWYALTHGKKE